MALPAHSLPADEAATGRGYPHLAYAGGGPPPSAPARSRPLANGLLGMAIFLGTETMLFAALISAFLILRAGSAAWPPPGQPRLPVALTGANTFLLLLSGYTMWRAVLESRRGRRRGVLRWLGATVGLGVVFLAIQGFEWVRLLGHGLTLSSSVYGAIFYTLIGCHGVHVLAAVVTLVAVSVGTVRRPGAGRPAELEVCRLYWLFVVGVWPLLYWLVYLS